MAIQKGNINDSATWSDSELPKVSIVKTDNISLDVYYFKPGQKIKYHRHPTGDQIFTVIEGTGKFYLDDNAEETIDVKAGDTFVAPKNVWHDLVNTGSSNLIAQQVTEQPAGLEWR
ncbi:MAG: cupin domain-containing protein [Nitrospinota bacterium]